MLPGEAPPGRGAPGLGAPGRGACGCGRGMGRSTGCADENGLFPTRGVRAAGFGIGPGRGPGVAPAGGACSPAGGGVGCPGAGAAGGAGAGAGAEGAGAVGAAASGAVGAGAAGAAAAPRSAGLAGALVASPLPPTFWIALSKARSSDLSGTLAAPLAPAAGLPPPNASRSLRATGASTVDDADLTNSPCSFSRASTSLLVTPSSLANSCTRALPATTSPV
jgi:hypothetical protein